MTERDITQTTQTNPNLIPDFSITSESIEEESALKETEYINFDWTDQLGYFKGIPELNRAITSLAIWTAGLGHVLKNKRDQVILENMTGWGEDSFTSIMINLIKTKKFGRDSYAEIIRDDSGNLLNLKVLNTGRIKHIINSQGLLERYEYLQTNGKFKKMALNKIFHLCNDRIANEIHGTSIVEIVKDVIDARKEVIDDMRRVSHLSSIRVMYVDENDPTRLANLKIDYAEAIKNGSVLIIPGTKKETEFQDLNMPPMEAFLSQIRFYGDFFYQAVGIPKVIATSENFTEAASKIGFLTFEPVYTNEQTQLEADIWNQLGIRIKFNRPPSLSSDVQKDEAKDGAVGFQPNDTTAGSGE